jgi:shikimate dehydrogenase
MMAPELPAASMDRYVVIGNPVAHSRSPDIHARFASETGDPIAYDRLLAPPGQFDRLTREFFAHGGKGANVTLPFKVDAFELAPERTARAELAGAANWLAVKDGVIACDNTDGAGLVTDLTANLGIALEGRRVLLVGAGGAARGVVAPLLAEHPVRLVIANRTKARALDLAGRFASIGPAQGAGLEEIAGAFDFDVVVNATSSSTRGERLGLPAGVLRAGVFAYDMAYGPPARAFLDEARAAGARAEDGLGMLVEQAAESFWLWRGKRPRTAPVIAALRAA